MHLFAIHKYWISRLRSSRQAALLKTVNTNLNTIHPQHLLVFFATLSPMIFLVASLKRLLEIILTRPITITFFAFGKPKMSAFKLNWSNPEAITWSPYTSYDGQLKKAPVTPGASVPLPVEVSSPSSVPTPIPPLVATDIPPPVASLRVLSASPTSLLCEPAQQLSLPLRPLTQKPLPESIQNSHTKLRGGVVAGTCSNPFPSLGY